MGLGTLEALVLTLVPLPKCSCYWSQGSLDEAEEARKRTAAFLEEQLMLQLAGYRLVLKTFS